MIAETITRLKKSPTARRMFHYLESREGTITADPDRKYPPGGMDVSQEGIVYDPAAFEGEKGKESFAMALSGALRRFYRESRRGPKDPGWPTETLLRARLEAGDDMAHAGLVSREMADRQDPGLWANMPRDNAAGIEKGQADKDDPVRESLKQALTAWFQDHKRVERTDAHTLDTYEDGVYIKARETVRALQGMDGPEAQDPANRIEYARRHGLGFLEKTPAEDDPGRLPPPYRLADIGDGPALQENLPGYMNKWRSEKDTKGKVFPAPVWNRLFREPTSAETAKRLESLQAVMDGFSDAVTLTSTSEREQRIAEQRCRAEEEKRARKKTKFDDLISSIREGVKKTPTGRRILMKAEKLGIRPPALDGTLKAGTAGMCISPSGKPSRVVINPRFVLDKSQAPEKGMITNTYVHEMTHGLVGKPFNSDKRVDSLPVQDRIFQRRLNEANAVAHSIQVAWELKEHTGEDIAWRHANGEPVNNPETGKTYKFAYSDAASAYVKSLEKNPEAGRNGTAMQEAFVARLCREDVSNCSYNNRYLEAFEADIQKPGTPFQRKYAAARTLHARRHHARAEGLDYLIKPDPLKPEELSPLSEHLSGNFLADKNGKMDWLLKEEIRDQGMPDMKHRLRLSRVITRAATMRRQMAYQPEKMLPALQKGERS